MRELPRAIVMAGAVASGPGARARARRHGRRRIALVLAIASLALVGAAATAGGIVEFRDPSSGDGEFPATISCSGPQNALVCSGGDAPQGAQAFTLLKVAEAAVAIQFVGGGVDDGSGVQSAPLVCSHPGDRLICSTAPPGESKSFAVYAPAA